MNLLVALMLTAGLNSPISATIPAALPASSAPRAEATLNRLVATAEPALRRQAVDQALADGTQRLGGALAVQLDSTQVQPATPRHHAKATLDRLVAEAGTALHQQAVGRALTDGTRRLDVALTTQLAATRIGASDQRIAARAERANPDRRSGAPRLSK